jgi:hypothetical protein
MGCPRQGRIVIGAQIDLLVFERASEPFDEDVVAPGAFAAMLIWMTFCAGRPAKAAR